MTDLHLDTVLQRLRDHGFEAFSHAARAAAVEAVLAAVPLTATVSRCGSMTCTELGLFEALSRRGTRVLDPYAADLAPEAKEQTRRQGLLADVLLTGVNAVTADGTLVDIDGVGNRVAGKIFGPGLVIVVAGVNKIVADQAAALHRIKTVACPRNARRLGLDTPCAQDRPCPQPDGCSSPRRMCNVTVVLARRPRLTRYQVHLVNESLGF